MTLVLGVDGCPGGWVGALVTARGEVEWRLVEASPAGVHQMLSAGSAATGIDVPIGLPATGARECDRAARRLLGGRRGTTVFPAPPRAILTAPSYGEACARSRRLCAKAVTRQTWNLVPRIADVDRVLCERRQAHVVEVHPEVSYAVLAGTPLPPKRGERGAADRLRALSGWLADPEAALAAAPRPARVDDALDALAVAWSARRWLLGQARVLPHADPPRDERSLRMEIVV